MSKIIRAPRLAQRQVVCALTSGVNTVLLGTTPARYHANHEDDPTGLLTIGTHGTTRQRTQQLSAPVACRSVCTSFIHPCQ
jgi:hypothetical protein